jgi:hypothetical protein
MISLGGRINEDAARWTDLLKLETIENIIKTARLLDGVGLDVVLGDDIGDSSVEVIEPVWNGKTKGSVTKTDRAMKAWRLTSVTGNDREGHAREELEGLH